MLCGTLDNGDSDFLFQNLLSLICIQHVFSRERVKTNRLSLRDGTPLLIQEVHTSYIDDEFELKTRLRVFLAWVMKFAEASLTPLSGVLQAKSCPHFLSWGGDFGSLQINNFSVFLV